MAFTEYTDVAKHLTETRELDILDRLNETGVIEGLVFVPNSDGDHVDKKAGWFFSNGCVVQDDSEETKKFNLSDYESANNVDTSFDRYVAFFVEYDPKTSSEPTYTFYHSRVDGEATIQTKMENDTSIFLGLAAIAGGSTDWSTAKYRASYLRLSEEFQPHQFQMDTMRYHYDSSNNQYELYWGGQTRLIHHDLFDRDDQFRIEITGTDSNASNPTSKEPSSETWDHELVLSGLEGILYVRGRNSSGNFPSYTGDRDLRFYETYSNGSIVNRNKHIFGYLENGYLDEDIFPDRPDTDSIFVLGVLVDDAIYWKNGVVLPQDENYIRGRGVTNNTLEVKSTGTGESTTPDYEGTLDLDDVVGDLGTIDTLGLQDAYEGVHTNSDGSEITTQDGQGAVDVHTNAYKESPSSSENVQNELRMSGLNGDYVNDPSNVENQYSSFIDIEGQGKEDDRRQHFRARRPWYYQDNLVLEKVPVKLESYVIFSGYYGIELTFTGTTGDEPTDPDTMFLYDRDFPVYLTFPDLDPNKSKAAEKIYLLSGVDKFEVGSLDGKGGDLDEFDGLTETSSLDTTATVWKPLVYLGNNSLFNNIRTWGDITMKNGNFYIERGTGTIDKEFYALTSPLSGQSHKFAVESNFIQNYEDTKVGDVDTSSNSINNPNKFHVGGQSYFYDTINAVASSGGGSGNIYADGTLFADDVHTSDLKASSIVDLNNGVNIKGTAFVDGKIEVQNGNNIVNNLGSIDIGGDGLFGGKVDAGADILGGGKLDIPGDAFIDGKIDCGSDIIGTGRVEATDDIVTQNGNIEAGNNLMAGAQITSREATPKFSGSDWNVSFNVTENTYFWNYDGSNTSNENQAVLQMDIIPGGATVNSLSFDIENVGNYTDVLEVTVRSMHNGTLLSSTLFDGTSTSSISYQETIAVTLNKDRPDNLVVILKGKSYALDVVNVDIQYEYDTIKI